MTLSMTLSFAGILPEFHLHYSRGIMFKNVAKTPYLTLEITLGLIPGFGSHFKAEMSVLTRVTSSVRVSIVVTVGLIILVNNNHHYLPAILDPWLAVLAFVLFFLSPFPTYLAVLVYQFLGYLHFYNPPRFKLKKVRFR